MRSGRRWTMRALVAVVVTVGVVAAAATAGIAASAANDDELARAGVLTADDFPPGFTTSAPSTTSHHDNLRLTKGVEGCGPYASLQKTLVSLPQARSSSFGDRGRTVSNEVDVFRSGKAANAALALYAKPSVVGCLEQIFEKQFRQDPKLGPVLDDVTVELDRQDIAGLGDESVVYEGTITLTATDGSTSKVAVGSAAVRVGRTADVVVYSTTGDALTDILIPAIDASVTRLSTALTRSAT